MTQTHFTLMSTFLLSLTGIATNRTHIMSMLLCIEAMTLILFISMALPPMNNTNMSSTPIILIALGACEAGTGLTLITITTKKNMNDHMKNLTLLKC